MPDKTSQVSAAQAETSWSAEHTDAVRIFVDHAWDVMRWHRERAQAWDRVAVEVLAFAGLIAALAGTLVLPAWRLVDDGRRVVVTYGLVATLSLLVLTCLVSLFSLIGRPRSVRSRTEEVQERWKAFRQGNRADSVDLLADLATTLIGEPGSTAPAIIDLRDAANRREQWTRLSALLLGLSVVLTSAVLVCLLISQPATEENTPAETSTAGS